MAEAKRGSLVGRQNLYTCPTCMKAICTVDKDDGTTPFTIQCQATPGCRTLAYSALYNVVPGTFQATHEWYRPSILNVMPPHLAAHVAKGGLLLRQILKLPPFVQVASDAEAPTYPVEKGN